MSESSPAGGVDEQQGLDRRVLAVGGVVILGMIMAMLDITVVNIAIAHLIDEFNSTLETIQWVATGYTLALATVIPLSGWAADRFGTKRIYLTAIAMFMIGSTLAGFAWSAESLIVFRVLQGLGGGMLMPLGMTILTKAAGPHRVGRVMSVLGVPMLLGPILGPILGGWLVDSGNWRVIFFLNIPIGLLSLALGARILDADEPRPAERLDVLGLLMLSPGLAALIYGLAKIPEYGGIGHAEVLLPGLIGAALVVGFVLHAMRSDHALIDLKLFKDKAFAIASVAMVLFATAFMGAMLLVPLFFQNVRGEGALDAGLLMAPQGVGAMIMMPIAGIVVDRVGAARIAPWGIVVIVASLLVFTQLEADTSYMLICGSLFVMGMGMGMTMMPIMSAALKTLRQENVARASTSLNIIQQVAGSIGTAMLSVLLANSIKDNLPPAPPGAPAPSGGGMQALPDAVREQVAPFLADAFSSTFVWAVVLVALSIIPALLLPKGRAAPPAPPAVEPDREAELVPEAEIR